MQSYIVTVTAVDRVGIVHAVTGAVLDCGGNIVELSQTVMKDFFTIILAVEVDAKVTADALRRAIVDRGRAFDLTVAVLPAGSFAAAAPPAAPSGERFILTVLGADHPGNIHGIAGRLAERGVNIVDLHARTDGPRFSMVMEAFLPADLSPAPLRDELETFGRNLGLEAFVQHENIFLATSEPRPVRVGAASDRREVVVKSST
jgi:glycine cleavage system transcriptional repressor